MSSGRIDTHHHHYPKAYLARIDDVLRRTTHAFYPRLVQWRPAHAIEAMDKAGIAVAVLSIGTPSVWLGDVAASRKFARECNDATARIQSDHRGRFGHFGTLPLPDVDGSLREIEYLFDTLRADGIGLSTNYDDKYPGDEAFAPVFDELNRRKAVVYFHPTPASFAFDRVKDIPPPTLEFPFDTTRAVASLMFGGTLARCPDIRWIFSHGGGTLPILAGRIVGLARNRPELAARVPNGVLAELRKLYYDVVAIRTPGAFAALREIADPARLLFGTDFPFWPPQETIDALGALELAATERAAIERGNALALLPRLNG